MLRLKRFLLTFIPLAGMLIGLPLLGVWLAGLPLEPYFEFPTQTRFVQHAPFSWTAFCLYSAMIAAAIFTVALRTRRSYRRSPPVAASGAHPFPGWGWAAVAAGAAVWVLAWTRFPWMAAFQPHTFTPLWLAYIVGVNALCRRRTGRSLLAHRPLFFLSLFPTSALFWWFFEYLNRFVQNWYYLGVEGFTAGQYILLASLSFSTVLPAVLSTRDLLVTWPAIGQGLRGGRQIGTSAARPAAIAALVLAGVGLTLIGVLPHLLFPLLWVSPLLIALALQVLLRRPSLLVALAAGDWRDVVAGPLAGLICGGFWETWNFCSLAKWEYAVPFVDRFHLFGMPVLGFAGYLPFGLECLVLGDLVLYPLHVNGGGAVLRNRAAGCGDPALQRTADAPRRTQDWYQTAPTVDRGGNEVLDQQSRVCQLKLESLTATGRRLRCTV